MSEGGPAAQLQRIFSNALKTKPRTEASSSSGQYQQKPWLQNTFLMGGQSAIAGAIFAGLRNALSGKSVGFLSPVGIFAAVGATFALTESVVANQRQIDDAINPASGACAAGFLLGIGTRSLPMAIGTCSIMGGLTGMYKYTDGMGARISKSTAEKSFFKPTAVVEAAKQE
ncbi:hypothetical protein B0H19DRAFT_1254677 [Mycena capillaripes]|nr:hypothetical protein B0H19DRAFT_1254677 [Mycena capillaripes]